MPKNRLIYIGVLIIAACALLFVAFQFTKFVQPVLPWALGVGILFIVIGILWEAKKGRTADSLKPGDTAAGSIKETSL